jgi:hypothetical protein
VTKANVLVIGLKQRNNLRCKDAQPPITLNL